MKTFALTLAFTGAILAACAIAGTGMVFWLRLLGVVL